MQRRFASPWSACRNKAAILLSLFLIVAAILAGMLVAVQSYGKTSAAFEKRPASAAYALKLDGNFDTAAQPEQEAPASAATLAADVPLAPSAPASAVSAKKLRWHIAQLQKQRSRAQDQYLRVCRRAAQGKASEDEKIVAGIKLDLIASELREAKENLAWAEADGQVSSSQ